MFVSSLFLFLIAKILLLMYRKEKMCAYKSKPDNMEGLSSLIQQRFTLFLISLHLYTVLHNRVV